MSKLKWPTKLIWKNISITSRRRKATRWFPTIVCSSCHQWSMIVIFSKDSWGRMIASQSGCAVNRCVYVLTISNLRVEVITISGLTPQLNCLLIGQWGITSKKKQSHGNEIS